MVDAGAQSPRGRIIALQEARCKAYEEWDTAFRRFMAAGAEEEPYAQVRAMRAPARTRPEAHAWQHALRSRRRACRRARARRRSLRASPLRSARWRTSSRPTAATRGWPPGCASCSRPSRASSSSPSACRCLRAARRVPLLPSTDSEPGVTIRPLLLPALGATHAPRLGRAKRPSYGVCRCLRPGASSPR